MAAIIFIAELISMGVIYFVNTPNYLVETFLDAMIMILLILPALYLLQMRPIRNQMNKRETADQALRKSEKPLRTVLELLPVGVWITDAKGIIQQGNQASQEIWGGARYVELYPGVDLVLGGPDGAWRLEAGVTGLVAVGSEAQIRGVAEAGMEANRVCMMIAVESSVKARMSLLLTLLT